MQAELDPSAHRFHARLALRHCGMLDRESRLKIRALYRDDYEWLPRVAGVDFEGCGKLSMPVPAPTLRPTQAHVCTSFTVIGEGCNHGDRTCSSSCGCAFVYIDGTVVLDYDHADGLRGFGLYVYGQDHSP